MSADAKAQLVWHSTRHSSNVAAVGYDGALGTLYVRFRNGGVYRYLEVHERVWDGLLDVLGRGSSVGKYVAAHLRGRYVTERVDAGARR